MGGLGDTLPGVAATRPSHTHQPPSTAAPAHQLPHPRPVTSRPQRPAAVAAVARVAAAAAATVDDDAWSDDEVLDSGRAGSGGGAVVNNRPTAARVTNTTGNAMTVGSTFKPPSSATRVGHPPQPSHTARTVGTLSVSTPSGAHESSSSAMRTIDPTFRPLMGESPLEYASRFGGWEKMGPEPKRILNTLVQITKAADAAAAGVAVAPTTASTSATSAVPPVTNIASSGVSTTGAGTTGTLPPRQMPARVLQYHNLPAIPAEATSAVVCGVCRKWYGNECALRMHYKTEEHLSVVDALWETLEQVDPTVS